ncbi:nitroreductase family protein [Leifsonia sp. Root112D2]|uniref:nitroreductase family protein n=1 Tax=Leifsonia sp. Root112D2 TaxID=1736426 RepID=UPI0009EC164E|nr:nitroreductase family protein [Leifsonia sp. Root112D2]
MGTALEAALARRSRSRVGEPAPSREQLLPLVAAASRSADHSSLRPWRLIELRGDARNRLGEALAASAQLDDKDAAKLAAKPLRAPLLIALVTVRRESAKVADWEQDAAAAGVAHTLSLLLDEAGWGVIWRTGPHTRSDAVRRMHALAPNEELLGWLYVGTPERDDSGPKRPVDAEQYISTL